MLSSSWLFWMAFMFIFFLVPVGYGSGFRRWGPPYPRYFQRRRAGQQVPALAGGAPVLVTSESWGWGGDFVWLVLLIGASWAFATLWWR